MATISSTPIIIDGKGHLLGRLASIVSKQILSGQKIVVSLSASPHRVYITLTHAEFISFVIITSSINVI
ncbi:hypothetical protein DL96DRAFT_1575234 [Flagelloscypha sp. PMI_526]|nr:hypothetical protein DL96DRAFT_1575234 [Flagelloscypha sp. PMI_526]